MNVFEQIARIAILIPATFLFYICLVMPGQFYLMQLIWRILDLQNPREWEAPYGAFPFPFDSNKTEVRMFTFMVIVAILVVCYGIPEVCQ